MHISEVARRTGFSRDTIRWYEKIGLITPGITERDANNYRNYNNNTLKRLLLIKGIKNFGFTLKEIEAMLSMEDNDQLQCTSVSEMVDIKVEAIDQQIEKLKLIRKKLQKGKEECTGNCEKLFM